MGVELSEAHKSSGNEDWAGIARFCQGKGQRLRAPRAPLPVLLTRSGSVLGRAKNKRINRLLLCPE